MSSTIDVCRECHYLINDLLSIQTDNPLILSTKQKLLESLSIFNNQVLNEFKLDELSISFNGGKDCLVMLIIYLSSLYQHYNNLNQLYKLDNILLNSIYINNELTFIEQDEFLMTSIIKYNLNLIQINDEMINGFQKYLNQNSKIKAIIVGIRKIDPFGANLNSIQLTDHNWPKFIRINPILNWTYNEIWFFIKFTNIEYCKLYDLGYTSIGGVSNTIRNPLLKLNNGDYLPAYELKDENAERLSRVSDNKINL